MSVGDKYFYTRYVSGYDLADSWSPDCSHTRAAAIAPKPPIDIRKPVKRKGFDLNVGTVAQEGAAWVVRGATNNAIDCALTLEKLAENWENVLDPPKPTLKLDLTKPIRFKESNEERKIVPLANGRYDVRDLDGSITWNGASADLVDKAYENFVRETYKFEFTDGIASVRPGKHNSGGATILFGIKAETSNPAITFTKTMSKSKVKELRDNLTKWLESVG